MWLYVAAFVPVLLVTSFEVIRLAVTLVVFLVGIGLFIAALWGLHLQLLRGREEHIAWARETLTRVYDSMKADRSGRIEEHSDALLAAIAVEDQASKIQRWPFDDRRLRQMATLVVTVVTFTLTGMVSRYLYESLVL